MAKPLAIITRLEDSPPELDRGLVTAYLRTVYRVLVPAFDVRIGSLSKELEQWPATSGLETFAFITAANPKSRLLPDYENDMRNEALLQALTPLTPSKPLPAVHLSGSGDWPPENSWWAPGLPADDAIHLGRQFEQNALVFWKKGKAVELWWL